MDLQALIRGNNRFWFFLYYDELIEHKDYQLTYCAAADEPYYNCAQAVSKLDEKALSDIEDFYISRRLAPAFYTDPTYPALLPFFKKRAYHELCDQKEHLWYVDFDDSFLSSLNNLSLDIEGDLLCFPADTEEDLHAFIEIDATSNALSVEMKAVLEKNLLYKRAEDVHIRHLIISIDGHRVACGSVGIYKGCVYLAEDGTLAAYRRRGLHTYMLKKRLLYAYERGANSALISCSVDSFTNRTAKKCGMQFLCERSFYTKEL